MTRNLRCFAATWLLSTILIPLKSVAQQSGPEVNRFLTSGTLNIILANKNGFVIGTDSRMSGDEPFPCAGRAQLHCDNSQKLFRTTPHSAFAIAGFAVGGGNTPLDLALAPVLRRGFGPNGLPRDENSDAIAHSLEIILEDALTDVAAICDPSTPSTALSVTVILARINDKQVPVLQQLQLTEAWTPMGPLKVLAPQYSSRLTPEVTVTKFFGASVGIKFVAEAILKGVYKSDDPLIRDYYRRRKMGQLDDMGLNEMSALAHVILRETEKFTEFVGGGDQMSEFASGDDATFHLPTGLTNDTQTTPTVTRWEGLECISTQTPFCGNAPVSFSRNPAQMAGAVRFAKLFIASEFRDIPVALDGNLFIGDSFEGVTLKWNGGSFFSYRNTFKDCVLELTSNAREHLHPELSTCRIVRNSVVDLPPGTIGLPSRPWFGLPGSFGISRDLGP